MATSTHHNAYLRKSGKVNGKLGYPLTDTERMWILCPCISVMCTVRIRGPLSEDRLAGALRKIQTSRPLLAMHVELDEEKQAYWVPQGTRDIPVTLVPKSSDEQWQSLLLPEQSLPFILDEHPLCRITWLHAEQSSDLILNFHHAVTDGISVALFVRELLNFLSDGDAQPIAHPLVCTKDIPIIPENAAYVSNEMLAGIEHDNAWWKENSLPLTKTDLLNCRTIPQDLTRFRYHICSLSETATQAALGNAKRMNVTLTSLLIAAFQRASYALYPRYSLSTDRLSKVVVPIGARQHYTIPTDDCFGFYAASVAMDLSYDSSLAREANSQRIHRQVQERMTEASRHLFTLERLFQKTDKDLFDATLMKTYFRDLPLDPNVHRNLHRLCSRKDYLDTVIEQQRFCALSFGLLLSNIGQFRCETMQSDELLEDLYFAQRVPPNCENMVTVVTAAGRLNISVCHDSTVLPEPLVAEICAAVKADLTAVS